MALSLPGAARPCPTAREFADLLASWGFQVVRERRADPHHISLRGPHGGRMRILASRQGRADADQITRAARLAHVDVEVFLAGPAACAGAATARRADVFRAEPRGSAAGADEALGGEVPGEAPGSQRGEAPAAEPVEVLFARLFPHGITMTPTVVPVFRRWAELTQVLSAHAAAPR
ncbi:hypothetical protein [Catellatospora sp. NPDC049133]|uniref:hypothetical protein n=1 Tax=Catellatospora sp. NPDC049133 TaxID=3155499 RepID=UPI0033C84E30